MEQWEYKTLDQAPRTAEMTTSELNTQGKDGWELVAAVPLDIAEQQPGLIRYLFKRRPLQKTKLAD